MLCPSCQKRFDPQSNLERAADELLPPDVDLYDFGGGIGIVPIPDYSSNSYLTRHFACLVTRYQEGMDIHKDFLYLPFRITAKWPQKDKDFSEQVYDDVKRAVAAWPEKALPKISLENLV